VFSLPQLCAITLQVRERIRNTHTKNKSNPE
jgi:hypothetical protein